MPKFATTVLEFGCGTVSITGVVSFARRVLEALDEAAKAGAGAAQLDGKMIDIASEKMARNLIAQADQIAAKAK